MLRGPSTQGGLLESIPLTIVGVKSTLVSNDTRSLCSGLPSSIIEEIMNSTVKCNAGWSSIIWITTGSRCTFPVRILIGIGGNPHSDTSHLWNTWISTLLDLGVPQALSRCKGFLVHEMSDYGYIDKHRGQLSVAPSWSRSYLDVFYVALNEFGIGLIIDHRKKSNDRARTNELFISNVPLWR